MGYILVDAKELDRQQIRHGEVLPDGRSAINMSMLRVMESVANIEFVSSEAEMREKLTAMGYYDEKPIANKDNNKEQKNESAK